MCRKNLQATLKHKIVYIIYMSLPSFRFNMRLKEGSPFGVEVDQYINIYEVDSVDVINPGSDVPSSASITLENMSTANTDPRKGNSENVGYPNEFTSYRPLIGQSPTTLQTYRGLVSLLSGVSFNTNINASFNLNISSGQITSVDVLNRGLYYGIGKKIKNFGLPYRSWTGDSVGNLDSVLTLDGGYFEGAPIEVVMNVAYSNQGRGNQKKFEDEARENLIGLSGSGSLIVHRHVSAERNNRPVKVVAASFPFNLATKTLNAGAEPAGGDPADYVKSVRYFSPNSSIYGAVPPTLGLTHQSLQTMSPTPVTLPTDPRNQGLRLHELPILPAERFDGSENFVIVQRADGSMRKMKFNQAIPPQATSGITFLEKSVRIVKDKLKIGAEEPFNITVDLKAETNGASLVPQFAKFVLVTIFVGFNPDQPDSTSGSHYPLADAVIGGHFEFMLSRGSGRQTPISKQILAPLTSSGKFVVRMAARGNGHFIVDLHGYG